MKQILLIFFCLLSLPSYGQGTKNIMPSGANNQIIWDRGGSAMDSFLAIPIKDTLRWATNFRYHGALTFRPQDRKIYFRDTIAGKWRQVGDGAFLPLSDTASMLSQYLKKSDSTLYVTITQLISYASNPSNINQDALHRFTTDNEKNIWNGVYSYPIISKVVVNIDSYSLVPVPVVLKEKTIIFFVNGVQHIGPHTVQYTYTVNGRDWSTPKRIGDAYSQFMSMTAGNVNDTARMIVVENDSNKYETWHTTGEVAANGDLVFVRDSVVPNISVGFCVHGKIKQLSDGSLISTGYGYDPGPAREAYLIRSTNRKSWSILSDIDTLLDECDIDVKLRGVGQDQIVIGARGGAGNLVDNIPLLYLSENSGTTVTYKKKIAFPVSNTGRPTAPIFYQNSLYFFTSQRGGPGVLQWPSHGASLWIIVDTGWVNRTDTIVAGHYNKFGVYHASIIASENDAGYERPFIGTDGKLYYTWYDYGFRSYAVLPRKKMNCLITAVDNSTLQLSRSISVPSDDTNFVVGNFDTVLNNTIGWYRYDTMLIQESGIYNINVSAEYPLSRDGNSRTLELFYQTAGFGDTHVDIGSVRLLGRDWLCPLDARGANVLNVSYTGGLYYGKFLIIKTYQNGATAQTARIQFNLSKIKPID